VLTQEAGKELRLVVVFDGDEDCVEENQNDYKPVERLTLDEVTNFYSAPDTDKTYVYHYL